MNVYELRDPANLRLRAHPWVVADDNPAHRYTDFRRHPDRIRTSLEDLEAWRDHAFAETFYRLIEWLNGPDSALESNDCSFNGLAPNEGPHSARRLEVSGRVQVLFRDLIRNTEPDRVGGLAQQVAMHLGAATPGLEAAVGVSIVDVHLTALPGPAERQRGQQLMLSFWAWGDDEAETLAALDQTLGNLTRALQSAR